MSSASAPDSNTASNTASNTSTSVNINKLKVPELKKMVTSKGLASPNTTQNLKRKELVELLKD